MEITVNKKQSDLTIAELEQSSKEQLIAKILQLQAHNKQLKNLLQKTLEKNTNEDKPKSLKSFDFSKSHKRHVLLKFLYLGWDYQGFASQEDTQATIEYHLFKALQKTCLIEKRENSNYNRCGRTDKGVSAFCQVISIDLRSKFPEDEQFHLENLTKEIDYCGILNRVLPDNIKCISWMPLKNKMYSARFDCVQRTYRYFFPTADLNIEAMQDGCKYLIGIHDFRNLCKMDVANGVKSFTRKIISADIRTCNHPIENYHKSYEMKYLEITSQAFLWHQIRCIMAVLFLIGQGHEDPSIIKELLDIEKNPCKPQYNLADGLPLNLYSCEFHDENSSSNFDEKNKLSTKLNESDRMIDWIYNKESLCKLIEDLQGKWTAHCVQSTMIREMITDIEKLYLSKFDETTIPNAQINVLLSNKQKQYQKLLNRKRCESLENRLDHYIKKKRLVVSNSTNNEDSES